jgi:DNA polymerase-1
MLYNLIRHPRLIGFTHFACTFDVSRENWRHKIDPGYKNRGPTKDDLVAQFKLAKRCVELYGLSVVEVGGYEADDVIATYCKQFQSVLDTDPCAKITIVSSDKDLMQLVSDRVTMLDTMKKPPLWIGVDQVIEKFSVPPCQVPAVLALAGDPVDHIVGLRGVGPVKAAAIVKANVSHGQIYDALGCGADAKRFLHNLSLVSLATDAPVPSLDSIVARPVRMANLVNWFDDLEFRQLKRHVLKSWGVAREEYAA